MNGVSFAGNLIVDFIKYIDTYPEISRLATIKSMKKSVGGLVCNTGIAFSRLCERKLKVNAYGRIGNDDNGKFIRETLKNEGINTRNIKVSADLPTSFTDVYTVEKSGERTFFQNRGANAEFSPEDVDLDSLGSGILHIGYLLLLDRYDRILSGGKTVMSEFLMRAQSKGIKTSIDVVSEQSERFASVVRPALPYINYLILNETESGMIAGIPPRDEDRKIDEKNIERICLYFGEAGVRDLAVIHAPEGSYCMGRDGRLRFCPAAELPEGSIKGKVGAGDAFTAGILYALCEGATEAEAMRLANAAAAMSLLGGGVQHGVGSAEKALSLYKKYNG